jgi:hypothetical protein
MSDTTKALLLSALRSAVLRAELDSNELKTIGIAFKADLITPAHAIVWLSVIGLIGQVRGATILTDTGDVGVLIDGDTGAIISGKRKAT